jgi:hypothetical protein
MNSVTVGLRAVRTREVAKGEGRRARKGVADLTKYAVNI